MTSAIGVLACKRLVQGVALWLIAALAQAATGVPNLSGVWIIAAPQDALLTLDGKPPPLLPPARKAYQRTSALRAAGDLTWDGSATRCKPPSEPRIMLEPMAFEIVQQPDKLFFFYQWNRLDRFVYIGRPLKVIAPTYFGTSVGQWQGDAFVIDAEGFNDKSFLDRDGMPRTSQLKLTERFTLSADGQALLERIHVDDPGTFSSAWDTQLRFKRLAERLPEDVCEERIGLVPTK